MKKTEKEPRPYRGLVDEIKEQHKKMKDMTFKEKWKYFWYYYKFHVIAIIAVLVFGGNLVHDMVTAKDYIFNGIMLNSSYLDQEPMEKAFAEYAELDTKNYDCFIDTLSTLSYSGSTDYDYSTFYKLVAQVQTKDLDVLVLDSQICYNFATNGMMSDLRTVLTEEELSAYEGNIYYIDYAEVKALEAADDTDPAVQAQYDERNNATAEEAAQEAELHRDSSSMKEPVPIGIFIADSPLVTKTYAYSELVPIFTFPATSQRVETAKKYLEFVWDETVPFENLVTVY